MEPKVTIPDQETEVDRVISGQSDLAYTLALEVLRRSNSAISSRSNSIVSTAK